MVCVICVWLCGMLSVGVFYNCVLICSRYEACRIYNDVAAYFCGMCCRLQSRVACLHLLDRTYIRCPVHHLSIWCCVTVHLFHGFGCGIGELHVVRGSVCGAYVLVRVAFAFELIRVLIME